MEKKSIHSLLGKVDWKNVKPSTYVRYILMIVSVVNLILNYFGVNPILVNEDQLSEFISTALPVIMLVINTYFDNPTSAEAIQSHAYMVELKQKNKEQSSSTEE